MVRYEIPVLTRYGWEYHTFHSLKALEAFRSRYKPDTRNIPADTAPF